MAANNNTGCAGASRKGFDSLCPSNFKQQHKITKSMENKELINTSDSMLVFGSETNFNNAQRMATALSKSNIIPANYQNNLPNCIIALEMANRIKMSPIMVMQNLYVVYGNPGWSSKFLIAALNCSGRFSPLRYEFRGTEGKDDWGCRAWATDNTGKELYGAWVDIAMAKAEGWYSKTGSKWKTMPQLMLQYRAGAFFARTFAPEIGMGMQTVEELRDTIDVPYQEVENSQKANDVIVLDSIATKEQANELLLKGSITKEDYDKVMSRFFEIAQAEELKQENTQTSLFPEDGKK